ncbi:bifunctional nicotinamide-nucleotide adenylyltransferase/Nudix hydroxylase [Candidatus Pacearchaeota archaeon]|nr:bifunctional nicotinamide-nucleotide adenylyltransferase/Nudix hydroxylase [Candidatus Pacearchaeota archaeon]
MNEKRYDLAVFIGRMQPLHNGHVQNITNALEIADNVLVIVGSTNQPRTPKNPFTGDERATMIKKVFPSDRVRVEGVEDFYPDTLWLKNVQTMAHKHIIGTGIDNFTEAKIAILGHDKDHTSFYLNEFPTWDFIEIGNRLRQTDFPRIIDATDIRNAYFESNFSYITDQVPKEILIFLKNFYQSPAYDLLVKEQAYITRYKKEWSVAPYAPTFVTTDAVVIQSGHVLLVKRRTEPGKGLWALPGGFVNAQERLEDGVIRELREETRLKVPIPVLRGSVKHHQVFDEPNRSLRGRTITNAYLFDLAAQPKLPAVKGGDDAEKAKWFPLNVVDAMGSILFEDHKLIIQTMVAKLED